MNLGNKLAQLMAVLAVSVCVPTHAAAGSPPALGCVASASVEATQLTKVWVVDTRRGVTATALRAGRVRAVVAVEASIRVTATATATADACPDGTSAPATRTITDTVTVHTAARQARTRDVRVLATRAAAKAASKEIMTKAEESATFSVGMSAIGAATTASQDSQP